MTLLMSFKFNVCRKNLFNFFFFLLYAIKNLNKLGYIMIEVLQIRAYYLHMTKEKYKLSF